MLSVGIFWWPTALARQETDPKTNSPGVVNARALLGGLTGSFLLLNLVLRFLGSLPFRPPSSYGLGRHSDRAGDKDKTEKLGQPTIL